MRKSYFHQIQPTQWQNAQIFVPHTNLTKCLLIDVENSNVEKCKGIFFELSKYVTKTAPKRSQSPPPPAKHRSCDSCVSVARYDELDRKINEMMQRVDSEKEDYRKLKDDNDVINVKLVSLTEENMKMKEDFSVKMKKVEDENMRIIEGYTALMKKVEQVEVELSAAQAASAPPPVVQDSAPPPVQEPPAPASAVAPPPAVGAPGVHGDSYTSFPVLPEPVVEMDLGSQDNDDDEEENRRQIEVLDSNKRNNKYERESPQFEARRKPEEDIACLICKQQIEV